MADQIAQSRSARQPTLDGGPLGDGARPVGERLSTAGGYEIRRAWSAEGWLYLLDDSYIGFFSLAEAEEWARKHPKVRVRLASP